MKSTILFSAAGVLAMLGGGCATPGRAFSEWPYRAYPGERDIAFQRAEGDHCFAALRVHDVSARDIADLQGIRVWRFFAIAPKADEYDSDRMYRFRLEFISPGKEPVRLTEDDAFYFAGTAEMVLLMCPDRACNWAKADGWHFIFRDGRDLGRTWGTVRNPLTRRKEVFERSDDQPQPDDDGGFLLLWFTDNERTFHGGLRFVITEVENEDY